MRRIQYNKNVLIGFGLFSIGLYGAKESDGGEHKHRAESGIERGCEFGWNARNEFKHDAEA